MPDEEVTACRIDIPQAALDDLADRLAGSSMRFYREDAHAPRPAEPTRVPVALAGFADDFFHSIRALARRDHGRIPS